MPIVDREMKQERVPLNRNMSRQTVASLSEVLCCEDVKIWLTKKGFSDIQVKPFGAKEKILECSSEEERRRVTTSLELSKENLILDLVPAEKARQPKSVLIWLKVWKIPIGYWSLEFISKVVSSLGSIVCFDEATMKGLRYDVARVLIVAPDPFLENQIIPISFDSVDSNVLIEVDYIYDERLQGQGEDEQSESSFQEPSLSATTEGEEVQYAPCQSPATISGEMGEDEKSPVADDASISCKTNDEEIVDCHAVADNNFELVNSDWPRVLNWTLENSLECPFNAVISGWCNITSQKYLKIVIPNKY